MKIQCNVCESAEAKVLCCADEAALCWACDEKVHAANKLAGKHQRVPLFDSSSPMPKCDICQEAVGYFFCLEDRALLCRKCDVAIHTVNKFVSTHRRFLLTGVKVGLECAENGASSSSGKPHSGEKEKLSGVEYCPFPQKTSRLSMAGEYSNVLPLQSSELGNFTSPELQLGGGSTPGSMPQWQLDEYYGPDEFNQNYGFMDHNSSKADSAKLGDSDCSSLLRMGEEELDGDECLGQVPDASLRVPEMPSPPTASGLYWPRNCQCLPDVGVFVPDICSLPMPNATRYRPSGTSSKRRRQF